MVIMGVGGGGECSVVLINHLGALFHMGSGLLRRCVGPDSKYSKNIAFHHWLKTDASHLLKSMPTGLLEEILRNNIQANVGSLALILHLNFGW